MKNKTAKFIIIAAIVMLAGWGCAKTPAANENANVTPDGYSPYHPASGEMTVKIIEDNSFEPTSAFVLPGTKVIFLNASQKEHGIASDDGGDKNALNGFVVKSLAPDENYSFTFDEIGRWFYYDTTNPAFGGVVEVMEKAETSPSDKTDNEADTVEQK